MFLCFCVILVSQQKYLKVVDEVVGRIRLWDKNLVYVRLICMLSMVFLPLFIIIPAKAFARDYVITGIGLSVCLSVCLLPR